MIGAGSVEPRGRASCVDGLRLLEGARLAGAGTAELGALLVQRFGIDAHGRTLRTASRLVILAVEHGAVPHVVVVDGGEVVAHAAFAYRAMARRGGEGADGDLQQDRGRDRADD